MFNEENLFDLSKYRAHNSIMNKESYLDFLFNKLTVEDFAEFDKWAKFYIDIFNKGYSVYFTALDYGTNSYLQRFIITLLETRGFILRIPTTDKFRKTILAKEPVGNFLCTANNLSQEGYLKLPKIEADVVYKHIHETRSKDLQSKFKIGKLPKKIGPSRLEILNKIETSGMTDEEAILSHIDKYGAVTRDNIKISFEKYEKLFALEKLEEEMKIIRVAGTQTYIRYIPSGTKSIDLSFERVSGYERISGWLNEEGFNELLEVEAKHFSEMLCIIMNVFKEMSVIVSIAISVAGREREELLESLEI